MSELAAVVVTYNAAAHIEAALSSLPDGLPVVVVDNASTDGTAELVRRRFPAVEVVAMGVNVGFAAAVNRGIDAVAVDADVFLLNPDARAVDGAVEHLRGFLDRHPGVGAASALVVDDFGNPERVAAGREPTAWRVTVQEVGLGAFLRRHGLYVTPSVAGPSRVDWVAGTAVVLRRRALDVIGRLDDSYFLYCEDIDLCRRMRDAGFEVWVVPGAKVRHARSALVAQAGAWVDEHRIGSLDRYLQRRLSRPGLTVARVARVVGKASRALAFGAAGLVRRDDVLRSRARQRWRDAGLAWRLVRGRG